MVRYKYTLTLYSDAQPGTGLGGETINDYIPRDVNDNPCIPASHIKGLMREQAVQALSRLNFDPASFSESIGIIFGNRYNNKAFEGESLISLSAATIKKDNTNQNSKPQLYISRTALNQYGTAKEGSLRTNEAIPAGTVFQGEVSVNAPEGSAADLMARLTLLSITALGGGRNRGCGKCQFVFNEQKYNAIEGLVDSLIEKLSNGDSIAQPVNSEESVFSAESLSKTVYVRLTFRANSPICAPETPWIKKNNIVSSGFSIPASAVRGALICHFRDYGDKTMEQLYNCKPFVVGSLQPCSDNLLKDANDLPVAIRVSLTHKAAKFSINQYNKEDFEDDATLPYEDDDAILPYEIEKVSKKAPMKASDGVLLVSEQGERRISLWKASDMPHMIQMHGVHRNADGDSARNLFTVDSMAPLIWNGWAVIPQVVFEAMTNKQNHVSIPVAFGTRRSVQGQGELSLTKLDDIPPEWVIKSDWKKTVFVVQSPISFPSCSEDNSEKTSSETTNTSINISDNVEDCFKERVTQWLIKHNITESGSSPINYNEIKTWVSTGYRTGWNRKYDGLQSGCFVILPGSVIQLPVALTQEQVTELLKSGFDLDQDDFKRGFGAICVHPGKAIEKYETKSTLYKAPSNEFRKKWVQEMKNLTKKPLPSPSQISALRDELSNKGPQGAIAYLQTQSERSNVSDDWVSCGKTIKELLKAVKEDAKQKECAIQILEFLVDLAIVKQ